MPNVSDWQIPAQLQPAPGEWSFDVDRALRSVLGLKSTIPDDAFTAGTLGTERAGSGVLIRADGLVLTIGYLVTEAETVWLTTGDGQAAPGHVLAYDQETGFGLVQALRRLDLPALDLGTSAALAPGDPVIVAVAGGRQHALKTTVVARQEFAGYWEYLVDRAVFTAPAHPLWGGAALIGAEGRLLGIGSLHLQHSRNEAGLQDVNMLVPIELLPPILDDLLAYGRPNRPPRPWLGLYAAEVGEALVVAGLASRGPAERAGLELGDRIVSVAGTSPASLAELWRRVWAQGRAGVAVPLELARGGSPVKATIESADRRSFLKGPRLH